MEENAAFQDIWAPTELDNFVPPVDKKEFKGSDPQDQLGGWKNSLFSLHSPRRHLKILKGNTEDVGKVRKDVSILLVDTENICLLVVAVCEM